MFERMTVAQLFEHLGFDHKDDLDDAVRWALVELYLRRKLAKSLLGAIEVYEIDAMKPTSFTHTQIQEIREADREMQLRKALDRLTDAVFLYEEEWGLNQGNKGQELLDAQKAAVALLKRQERTLTVVERPSPDRKIEVEVPLHPEWACCPRCGARVDPDQRNPNHICR